MPLPRRALDKPVFLSVGYSACHWCHVMAHDVVAWQHRGPVLRRAPEDHAGERHDARRVEIPREAVHARGHRRALRPAETAATATAAAGITFFARRLAVDRAHHLSLGIEEIDRQLLRLRSSGSR